MAASGLEFIAKKGIVSRGDVFVTSSVVATSFTGSYFGTSSWANNSISASWAPSTGGGTSLGTGSTYPFTSSWSGNSITSSILIGNLTASVPSYQEGLVFYDTASRTLAYYNENPNVTMNIGQEMWIRVYNSSSNYISNSRAVYLSGSFNQTPIVYLAIADGTGTRFNVAGLATCDIPNGSYGYITEFGVVHGIDTSVYPTGTPLYLSTITSGSFQTSIPTGSSEKVLVGYVLTSSVSSGNILVDINPFTLGSISSLSSSYLTGSDPTVSSSVHFTNAAAGLSLVNSGNDLLLQRNDGAQRRSLLCGNVTATGTVTCQNETVSNALVTNQFTATNNVGGYFEQVLRMSQTWDFFNYTSSGVNPTASLSQADGWLINTGSILTASAEANHPGIILRRTSAVQNQVNGFFPGGLMNSSCTTLQDSDRFRVIMNLVTGSVNQVVRIGFFDNMANEVITNGVYFEKTGSNNTWMAIVRSASLQWTGSTTVNCTSSNVWQNFLITNLSANAGGMSFYISNDNSALATWNGETVGALSATLPLTFGIQTIPKQATTSYDYKIDFIRYDSAALVR